MAEGHLPLLNLIRKPEDEANCGAVSAMVGRLSWPRAITKGILVRLLLGVRAGWFCLESKHM